LLQTKATILVGQRSACRPGFDIAGFLARKGDAMARIVVQDCLDRIPNRFILVMIAARRMRQLQKGSDSLIDCKNKEAVTALREIAAGRVGLRSDGDLPGYAELVESLETKKRAKKKD
jgi:DNA-directed RNA polymerase subunit omega